MPVKESDMKIQWLSCNTAYWQWVFPITKALFLLIVGRILLFDIQVVGVAFSI